MHICAYMCVCVCVRGFAYVQFVCVCVHVSKHPDLYKSSVEACLALIHPAIARQK